MVEAEEAGGEEVSLHPKLYEYRCTYMGDDGEQCITILNQYNGGPYCLCHTARTGPGRGPLTDEEKFDLLMRMKPEISAVVNKAA